MVTAYSEKVEGDRGNFKWTARFDITDGYLGVTQFEGDEVKDRVLLSPDQVEGMIAFVRKCKARKR